MPYSSRCAITRVTAALLSKYFILLYSLSFYSLQTLFSPKWFSIDLNKNLTVLNITMRSIRLLWLHLFLYGFFLLSLLSIDLLTSLSPACNTYYNNMAYINYLTPRTWYFRVVRSWWWATTRVCVKLKPSYEIMKYDLTAVNWKS